MVDGPVKGHCKCPDRLWVVLAGGKKANIARHIIIIHNLVLRVLRLWAVLQEPARQCTCLPVHSGHGIEATTLVDQRSHLVLQCQRMKVELQCKRMCLWLRALPPSALLHSSAAAAPVSLTHGGVAF